MIRDMRYRIALAALAMLLSSAVAYADDDRPFHFSLEWQVRYGQLDGYVQIPSGGEPGTTSSHRPTFGELGINNTGVYDFAASFDWGRDGFYVGAEFMRPSGDTTLDEPLVSHGVTFAAGTPVSSKVQLDWYRAGYQHHFDFANPDDPWSLTLTPMAGVAVLNFDYNLDGPGALNTSRSFIKPNVQGGLTVEWHPVKRWPVWLEGKLLGSPPISSWPLICDEQLLAKFRVFERNGHRLAGFVGIDFEQIHFEDDQTVPNRIKADFGPMVVFGLDFRF